MRCFLAFVSVPMLVPALLEAALKQKSASAAGVPSLDDLQEPPLRFQIACLCFIAKLGRRESMSGLAAGACQQRRSSWKHIQAAGQGRSKV